MHRSACALVLTLLVACSATPRTESTDHGADALTPAWAAGWPAGTIHVRFDGDLDVDREDCERSGFCYGPSHEQMYLLLSVKGPDASHVTFAAEFVDDAAPAPLTPGTVASDGAFSVHGAVTVKRGAGFTSGAPISVDVLISGQLLPNRRARIDTLRESEYGQYGYAGNGGQSIVSSTATVPGITSIGFQPPAAPVCDVSCLADGDCRSGACVSHCCIPPGTCLQPCTTSAQCGSPGAPAPASSCVSGCCDLPQPPPWHHSCSSYHDCGPGEDCTHGRCTASSCSYGGRHCASDSDCSYVSGGGGRCTLGCCIPGRITCSSVRCDTVTPCCYGYRCTASGACVP